MTLPADARPRLAGKARLRFDRRSARHLLLYPERGLVLSPTAAEIRARVLRAFPQADITFKPDKPRARIIDSWPADVDDTAARRDWGWQPDYDFARAFDEYLVPTISRCYAERK